MQKILVLATSRDDLRSEVEAWDSIENPQLYRPDKPIGLTPSEPAPWYKSVLEALADGWELLGPPVECKEETYTLYNWWLKKDC